MEDKEEVEEGVRGGDGGSVGKRSLTEEGSWPWVDGSRDGASCIEMET